jgi:hypothetical protein
LLDKIIFFPKRGSGEKNPEKCNHGRLQLTKGTRIEFGT